MRCSIPAILATVRLTVCVALTWLIGSLARISWADIYQWEWIDPNNHALGRQESSTLCSDGAGRNAVPGVWLYNLDLTQAWLHNSDLQSAIFQSCTLANADMSLANLAFTYFQGTTLTDAYLSQANLTRANFRMATLTGVDFTGAEVPRADFGGTTSSGFTAAQLYSTASYQAGGLSGISLDQNDLAGWDFANQNLTDANFSSATLTGTDFTGAEVRGARFLGTTNRGFTAAQLYSTASYHVGNLSGIHLCFNDLAGWDFVNQNLTDACFWEATLIDADFTGAEVRGVSFQRTTDSGFTAAQLYSTASYQAGNLSGIRLMDNNLTGWDLTNLNLTDAYFWRATLTGADFSGADTRGAHDLELAATGLETRNTIFPDGAVYGLVISSGETVRLWDYDPETPLLVEVHDKLQIDGDGALRIVIEDTEWGSTLTFEDGIAALLGGTLELLVDLDGETTIAGLVVRLLTSSTGLV